MDTLLLHFDDDAEEAQCLARAAEVERVAVGRLAGLSDELQLLLPPSVPRAVALYRRFDRAQEKLLELLLLERHLTRLGARHLSLLTPSLGMLKAEHERASELLSLQQVQGQFLLGLFDTIITPGSPPGNAFRSSAALAASSREEVQPAPPAAVSRNDAWTDHGQAALSRLALALDSMHAY